MIISSLSRADQVGSQGSSDADANAVRASYTTSSGLTLTQSGLRQ